ncbi:hypothetical protein [Aliihoeflea sp. 2WW]|uniref:hypothetical protein n=1 Tax=Aliihoeflea sp. 2WW TaxID=1381123 RepID=UPI001268C5FB|nr:hypothetical protein [Aliihoeflea sp. 2WW]
MPDNANTPPVRDTGATGVPENDKRDLIDDEHSQAAQAPKTSGAPERGKEPLTNKLADRNTEGPREAGTTPRPTDKPIVGGDRGA